MINRIFFLLSIFLHNRDLLLRQSIQLIDQRVYLPVGGLDPALQSRLLVGRAGLGGSLWKGGHLVHKGYHLLGEFYSVSFRVFVTFFTPCLEERGSWQVNQKK